MPGTPQFKRSLTLFLQDKAMLHAHKFEPVEDAGGEVLAFPARAAFGRRAPKVRLNLVVDLHAEEWGPRWFRGAGTLTALCAVAFLLAPDFQPLVPAPAKAATLQHQDLATLAGPALAQQPEFTMPKARGLLAGEKGGLKRLSGDVSDGLYWSLRGAGASPQLAADYLKALATATDVGEVAPYDRFEFITGKDDALVYAGLDRAAGEDVNLIKWTANGRTGWFDGAESVTPASSGLMAPVAGRITSGFGSRVHPILRFTRFHAGIDFGAAWGSPIVAAADGTVVGAGYAGGYGRQVRIAHSSGIMTTYSHMSAIAAASGTPVRQGQVIGYVGSSGLSTGPHLHFEVRVNGQPVNPLTARLISRPQVDKTQVVAFKARLKALMAIPVKAVATPAA